MFVTKNIWGWNIINQSIWGEKMKTNFTFDVDSQLRERAKAEVREYLRRAEMVVFNLIDSASICQEFDSSSGYAKITIDGQEVLPREEIEKMINEVD